MKTGTLNWLKTSLKDKWERTRRNIDYIEFCETHAQAFDENGTLDTFAELTLEAEAIRDRFGLEMIYHPSIDISQDQMLQWPIFKNPLAVGYEWREEKPDCFTPIWDDHYIKLTIDINPERNLGQITDEVKEFVTSARAVLEIDEDKEGNSEKRPHFDKRMDYYRIWDERNANKPFSVIARELGISDDLAKKRYYKGFKLITGEQYDKDIWKRLIHKTLEQRVKNLKGRDDKNTWKDLLDFEQTTQKNVLIKAEPNEDGKRVYIEDWNSQQGLDGSSIYTDPEARLLCQDIEKICKKCGDTACYKAMLTAFRTDNFESWDACPNIYAFVKLKN
ncbi:MAG: hypothetical protein JW883_04370 [Deltaproteobacteria bacterium]|nr:hypothetical protein [Deltaproteobacteria bacterium]